MNRLIGDLVDVTSIDAGKLAMAPVRRRRRGPGGGSDGDVPARGAREGHLPLGRGPRRPPARGVRSRSDAPGLRQPHLERDQVHPSRRQDHASASKRAEGRFGSASATPGWESPRRCWRRSSSGSGRWARNDRRGQGLGLYISKCIVEAHRGRIWAESEPGKGSRLHFTLPAPSARPRTDLPGSAGRKKARPARRGK